MLTVLAVCCQDSYASNVFDFLEPEIAQSPSAMAEQARWDVCMIFGKQINSMPAMDEVPPNQEARIDRDLGLMAKDPQQSGVRAAFSGVRAKIRAAAEQCKIVNQLRHQHAQPEELESALDKANMLIKEALRAKDQACSMGIKSEIMLPYRIINKALEKGARILQDMQESGIKAPPCNLFVDSVIRAAGGSLPWQPNQIPRAGNWIPQLDNDTDHWQRVSPANGSMFTPGDFQPGDVVIWAAKNTNNGDVFYSNHVGIAGENGQVIYTGSARGFKVGSMQWWLNQMPGNPNWQFGQPQAVFRPREVL